MNATNDRRASAARIASALGLDPVSATWLSLGGGLANVVLTFRSRVERDAAMVRLAGQRVPGMQRFFAGCDNRGLCVVFDTTKVTAEMARTA